MPENQQGRSRSNVLTTLLEEVVLIGVGVLLVFLGVFSTVPLTSIVSAGIGTFLFYTAYESYRRKTGNSAVAEDVDGREEEQPEEETIYRRDDEYFEEKEIEEEDDYTPRPTMPVRETVQPQRSREPMPMQSAYTADDFFEEKFTATMSQAEPQR